MNRAGRPGPDPKLVFAPTTDAQAKHDAAHDAPGASPSTTALSLENMIGFTGAHRHTLLFHPRQNDVIVFAIGKVVVLSALTPPQSQRFLRGHDGEICALAMSPSGRLLASGQMGEQSPLSSSAPVCLWNVQTGALVTRFGHRSLRLRALAFSDDERWLACATDNALALWEIATGDLVTCPQRQAITAMAFGAPVPCPKARRNPSYLVYSCVDSAALIHRFDYDIKTMQYDATTRKCDAPGRGALVRCFTCCTLDETKQFLLCGSTAGDVSVFNVDVGQFRASFPVCSAGVHSLITNGDLLLAGGGDGTLSKYKGGAQQWDLVDRLELGGAVNSLSNAADGCEVIAGTASGRIYRVRVVDRLDALLVHQSPTVAVVHIAFAANRSNVFATISARGTIMVWDLADYTVVSSAQGPCQGCVVEFNNEGNGDESLLSGWADGAVRAHSIATGTMLWEIPHAVRGAVTAIAQRRRFIIVAGSTSGSIRVLDRVTRSMVAEYVAHTLAPVSAILVDCRNENIVHSCGADRRHVSYDFARRVFLAGHQIDNGHFEAVAQRRTGEAETATAISDGRIMTWDIDATAAVNVHRTSNHDPVHSIDVSRSGQFVVAGQGDDLVAVYRWGADQKFTLVGELRVHSGRIRSVRWTPDGRQIVSTGDDCCICIVNFTAPAEQP
ncbi:unnamed protein product (mitochondrion) [Plasmodiophora brassicae]|uniref:Cilia- and flagella-associated protein 52 n=1 Tax=Plasmodiophora brassicae TaxID=37360 RepID=A0A3P3YLZ5_PLABS|nr:unnamed protein product [Plasmodiophora brassicae]